MSDDFGFVWFLLGPDRHNVGVESKAEIVRDLRMNAILVLHRVDDRVEFRKQRRSGERIFKVFMETPHQGHYADSNDVSDSAILVGANIHS